MLSSMVYGAANNEQKCGSFAKNQSGKQVLNTPLSMILSAAQREKSAHFSLAACHWSKFTPTLPTLHVS